MKYTFNKITFPDFKKNFISHWGRLSSVINGGLDLSNSRNSLIKINVVKDSIDVKVKDVKAVSSSRFVDKDGLVTVNAPTYLGWDYNKEKEITLFFSNSRIGVYVEVLLIR